MIRKFLKAIYQLCWYSVAAVIIMSAISITLVRMLLPEIGEYREDIQAWVSSYMSYPVEIESIDANWEGWIPNLYLSNINVLNKDGTDSLVTFDRAHLSLDPITSIKQRNLVPLKLIVSGLDLSIIRQQDGSIIIAKSTVYNSTGGPDLVSTELTDWLRMQRSITIENVNLNWIDQRHDYGPLHLSNASIRMSNDMQRLQANGYAYIDNNSDAKVTYAIDIFGNILTPHWSGNVYLEGSNISSSSLINSEQIFGFGISADNGDFKLWSDWDSAKLIKIQGQASFDQVTLGTADSTLNLKDVQSELQIERAAVDDWYITVNTKEFTTQSGIWPATDMQLQMTKIADTDDYRFDTYISYLKFEDIYKARKSIPALHQYLPKDISVQGDIYNARIRYDAIENNNPSFITDADFEHVTINTSNGLSVNGLKGHISRSYRQGTLILDTEKSRLVLPGLYDSPIWLYSLHGPIDWYLDINDEVKINTNKVTATTSDFNFTLTGSTHFMHEPEDYFLDIVVSIESASLDSLFNYLPKTSLGSAIDWLQQSVLGGQLSSTDLIIRGALSDFPFSAHEGRFQVITQIENATLDYSPNWPPIDNINAEIKLDGNALTVSTDSAKIFAANMKQFQAVIPDIIAEKADLKLAGKVTGTAKDAMLFLNQSPLHKNPALTILQDLDLQGPVAFDLNIDIPLYKANRKVSGNMALIGNSLESKRTGIYLDELTGNVRFTQDTITAKNITGKYFGREISMNIIESEDTPNKQIVLKGSMDRDFMRKQFNHYFPDNIDLINDYLDRFSGTSHWQANLDTYAQHDQNKGQKLIVSSNLIGMSIDLPGPLAKPASESLNIKLKTYINDEEEKILDVQCGNLFAARFEYSEAGERIIDTLNLNFTGDIDKLVSSNGISINGKIDRLNLTEWINLIRSSLEDQEQTNKTSYDDTIVNVEIAELDFFSQTYHNVKLHIEKPIDGWQIQVDSDSIAGLISIPNHSKSVILDLSKLSISKSITEEETLHLDPSKFPSIHAHVKELIYEDINLGEMYLETSELTNGLSFDNLSFKKPEMTITGHGEWLLRGEQNISRFNIDVDAENLINMLETFNYNVASIKDGHTDITIEANWIGTPMDFSLSEMNGKLSMVIQKGQFLDLEPKAGRFFGLLSIQSLPRRLALDFRDIFGKGLSFDQIEGIFTIENGNAYTNDLKLVGPSANIEVTGRTGLITQDYDQIVTVIPQIADSLPVASALFGPIGVGVGAVLYFASELFESLPKQIDKILQYQYTITGSWDNPIVEKYNKSEASG